MKDELQVSVNFEDLTSEVPIIRVGHVAFTHKVKIFNSRETGNARVVKIEYPLMSELFDHPICSFSNELPKALMENYPKLTGEDVITLIYVEILK